jgi:hypothetical protein
MNKKPEPFWIARIAAGQPARLRNPGESVEDYRVAMGWDAAPSLHDELIRVARLIEDLKLDCGMDPESAQAIRNGRYMSLAAILRGLAQMSETRGNFTLPESPRGTDAQILKERELTIEAINGAMAFGEMNTNPPPDADHWLAPFWHIGRKLGNSAQAKGSAA